MVKMIVVFLQKVKIAHNFQVDK